MMHRVKKAITWLLITAMLLTLSLPGAVMAFEISGAEQGQSETDSNFPSSGSAEDGSSAEQGGEIEPEPDELEPDTEENSDEDEEDGDSAEEGNTSEPDETDSSEDFPDAEDTDTEDPDAQEPDEENPEKELPEGENPEMEAVLNPVPLDELFATQDIFEVASWTALETAIEHAADGDLTVITITGDLEADSLITIPELKHIRFVGADVNKPAGEDVLIYSNSGTDGIGFSLTGTDIALAFEGITLQGSVGITLAVRAEAQITGLKISDYALSDGTSYSSNAIHVLYYASLTLIDCEFTNVAYNAIRSTSADLIKITDSSFTDTRYSALYCHETKSIELDNVQFSGTKEHSTVYIQNFDTVSALTVNGCGFYDNTSSERSGSAINALGVTEVTIENSTFDNNISTKSNNSFSGSPYGGAYYQQSGTLFMEGCTFTNNRITGGNISSGGAMYLSGVNGEITSSTFSGNSSSSYGGAITFNSSSRTLTMRDVTVSDNAASWAGGIEGFYGTIILNDGVTISGNTAEYGAGIYATHLIIDGSEEDAIMIEHNAASMHGGGMFYRRNGLVEIKGGLTLQHNSARRDGGGMYYTAKPLSTIAGTASAPTKIIENTADNGGGIIITQSPGGLSLSGNIIISDNVAHSSGAGIDIRADSKLSIAGDAVQIINNQAAVTGGGICAQSSTISLDGTQIINNTAQNNGGGIYIAGNNDAGEPSILTNLQLESNEALNGGGLAVYGTSKVQATGLTVTNNTAANNGGGISASRDSLAGSKITDITFAGNTARTYVNVLSESDYDEYGAMESTIINDVTGSSLPAENSTMYYLDPNNGLTALTEDAYRAYNNYDFAYHEIIYTLEYNLHGGSGVNADTNHYGAGVRLTTSPDADKIPVNLSGDVVAPPTGREFAGWSQSLSGPLLTSEDGLYYINLASLESDPSGAGKINLHARYNLKKLTVTYRANGGKFDSVSGSDTLLMQVEYGNAAGNPAGRLVHHDGLVFIGWYNDPDSGSLADLSSITDDTEVYAHWLHFDPYNQFEIIYHPDENSDDVYYHGFYDFGQAITDLGAGYIDPSRRGHRFSGWYEENAAAAFDFDSIVSNPGDGSQITYHLYAHWDLIPYKVIIKNSANSESDIVITKDSVTHSNQFENHFIYNNDVIQISVEAGSHLAGYQYIPQSEVPLVQFRPAASGDGYELYNFGSDLTLELTTELDQYSISFFSNTMDEIPLADYLIKHNKTIDDSGYTIPSYDKPGYKLIGWIDASSRNRTILTAEAVAQLPVTAPVTYIGAYESAYTVKFIPNNASLTENIDPLVVTNGQSIPLPALTGTATDDFLGWAWSETAETPDFTATQYRFNDIFSDVTEKYATLYGVWHELDDNSGGGGSPGGNTARLTVEYRDENGDLIDSVVTSERIGKTVTVTAPDFAGYTLDDERTKTITIAAGRENIVTFYYNSEPLYPSLERDRRIPYIEGYPDGTVRPDANLTRGEIATALFRLVTNVDKNAPRNHAYTDVSSNMWYHQPIAFLSDFDVLTGYSDRTFRPENAITRAEFTAVLSRFGGMQSAEVRFTDVPASHWAMQYISNASAQGWIMGYPDGSFRPEESISRAEAITMINRMLERTPANGDFAASDIPYTDLTAAYWAWLDILEATIGGLD